MDFKRNAEDVLRLVGGKENVESFTNCVTRLRIIAINQEKVNVQGLEEMNDVIHVQVVTGVTQVVFGPQVKEVAIEFDKLLGGTKVAKKDQEDAKVNFSTVIQQIIFPVIPILLGVGFIRLLTIFMQMAKVSPELQFFQIFSFIGDQGFNYLPVFLGFSLAKVLKINPLYAILFGVLIYDPKLANMNVMGQALTPGAGGMFTVLLSVISVFYVDKLLTKVLPTKLEKFKPFFTIGLTGAILFLAIFPVSLIIMGGITKLFTYLTGAGRLIYILTCTIMGGLWTLLVMFGMHLAVFAVLMPIYLSMGSLPFIAAAFLGGAGQVGAALSIWLRYRKEKPELNDSIPNAIPAVFGVVEPLMYSINLPRVKPFIISVITGAIMGTFVGIFSLEMVLPMPGLVGAVGFAETSSMIIYAGLWIGSVVVSFILTSIFYKEKGSIKVEKSKAIDKAI